jgi:hypothetical protein
MGIVDPSKNRDWLKIEEPFIDWWTRYKVVNITIRILIITFTIPKNEEMPVRPFDDILNLCLRVEKVRIVV